MKQFTSTHTPTTTGLPVVELSCQATQLGDLVKQLNECQWEALFFSTRGPTVKCVGVRDLDWDGPPTVQFEEEYSVDRFDADKVGEKLNTGEYRIVGCSSIGAPILLKGHPAIPPVEHRYLRSVDPVAIARFLNDVQPQVNDIQSCMASGALHVWAATGHAQRRSRFSVSRVPLGAVQVIQQFEAGNIVLAMGEQTGVYVVRVEGPPTRVRSVTVVPASTTSAKVTFVTPETRGAPITGFTVNCSDGSSETVQGSMAKAVLLQSLTSGQRYTVTVVAHNSFGTSEASRPRSIEIPTDCRGPPNCPANPASRLLADGGVGVSWEEGTDNGAPVIEYIVRSDDGLEFSFPGDVREGTLRGLVCGRTPKFTVSARNAFGESIPSLATRPLCLTVPSCILFAGAAGGRGAAADATEARAGSLGEATQRMLKFGSSAPRKKKSKSVTVASESTLQYSEDDLSVDFWVLPGYNALPSDSSLTTLQLNCPFVGSTPITNLEDDEDEAIGNGFCVFGREWYWVVQLSDGSEAFEAESKVKIDPDKWSHLAFTYRAATRELATYTNGALSCTVVCSDLEVSDGASDLVVGCRKGSIAGHLRLLPFLGAVYNLRIWKTVLPLAQIINCMNYTFDERVTRLPHSLVSTINLTTVRGGKCLDAGPAKIHLSAPPNPLYIAGPLNIVPAASPEPVTDLLVKPGCNSLRISFTLPKDNGLLITSCTAQAKKADLISPRNRNQAYTAVAKVPSTAQAGEVIHLVITGLEAGERYDVTAFCESEAGASAPCMRVPGVPIDHLGPPQAPQKVQTKVTFNTAFLVWTHGSDGGSDITHHIIRCSPPAPSGDIIVSNPRAVSHSIRGLALRTAYTITIMAVNEFGESPPSAPQSANASEIGAVTFGTKVTGSVPDLVFPTTESGFCDDFTLEFWIRPQYRLGIDSFGPRIPFCGNKAWTAGSETSQLDTGRTMAVSGGPSVIKTANGIALKEANLEDREPGISVFGYSWYWGVSISDGIKSFQLNHRTTLDYQAWVHLSVTYNREICTLSLSTNGLVSASLQLPQSLRTITNKTFVVAEDPSYAFASRILPSVSSKSKGLPLFDLSNLRLWNTCRSSADARETMNYLFLPYQGLPARLVYSWPCTEVVNQSCPNQANPAKDLRLSHSAFVSPGPYLLTLSPPPRIEGVTSVMISPGRTYVRWKPCSPEFLVRRYILRSSHGHEYHLPTAELSTAGSTISAVNAGSLTHNVITAISATAGLESEGYPYSIIPLFGRTPVTFAVSAENFQGVSIESEPSNYIVPALHNADSLNWAGDAAARVTAKASRFAFRAGQDFAIEVWLKLDERPEVARTVFGNALLPERPGTGTVVNGFALVCIPGEFGYVFLFGDGATQVRIPFTLPKLTQTSWHHIAVCVDRKSDASVYVDAGIVAIGNVQLVGDMRGHNPFCIAIDASMNANTFRGRMRDLRIWKCKRTQRDVRKLMIFSLDEPVRGLLASWPLDGQISQSEMSRPGSSGSLRSSLRSRAASVVFDEATMQLKLLDFSGYNHNAQVIGPAPAVVPGPAAYPLGRCITLKGNSYCSTPLYTDLRFGSAGAFTVEFWMQYSPAAAKYLYPIIGTAEWPFGDNSDKSMSRGWMIHLTKEKGVCLVLNDGIETLRVASRPIPANEWTHVAAVVDRAGFSTLFVNGLLEDSTNLNLDYFGSINNAYGITIRQDSTRSWERGFPSLGLCEVRIWNRVRTKDQVMNCSKYRMQGTEVGLISCWTFEEVISEERGSDASTDAGLPPSSISAGSTHLGIRDTSMNGVHLEFTANTEEDNMDGSGSDVEENTLIEAQYSHQAALNDSVSVASAVTSIELWYGASLGPAPPLVPTTTKSHSIIFHMQMDDENYLAEAHGLQIVHDTKSGRPNATPIVDSQRGICLLFDGRSSLRTKGFAGVWGPKARTLMCWIKLPMDMKEASSGTIFSWGKYETIGENWAWGTECADKCSCQRVDLGHARVRGSRNIADGQWHHITVRLIQAQRGKTSAGNIEMFVDGVLDPLQMCPSNVDINTAIESDAHIGSDTRGGSFFTGLMQDLRVYNKAIDNAEIKQAYDSSLSDSQIIARQAIDFGKQGIVSISPIAITSSSSTSSSVSSSSKINPRSKSLAENGPLKLNVSAAYGHIPKHNLLHFKNEYNFTIEMWIKAPLKWTNLVPIFGDKVAGVPLSEGILLYLHGEGHDWGFSLSDGAAHVDLVGGDVGDSEWHHIAVAVDRLNNVTLLQNGQYVNSKSIVHLNSLVSPNDLHVAQDGTGVHSNTFRGALTDLRFWRAARSAQQIQELMHFRLEGTHDDLAAYWRMNEVSSVAEDCIHDRMERLDMQLSPGCRIAKGPPLVPTISQGEDRDVTRFYFSSSTATTPQPHAPAVRGQAKISGSPFGSSLRGLSNSNSPASPRPPSSRLSSRPSSGRVATPNELPKIRPFSARNIIEQRKHQISSLVLPLAEDDLRREFEDLDKSGGGFLSREDMREIYYSWEHFGAHPPEREVEAMLDSLDPSGESKYTFQQYALMALRRSRR